MKNNDSFKKTDAKKGLIIASAVIFSAIILVVSILRTTTKKLGDQLSELTLPESIVTENYFDAQNDLSDIPDTREDDYTSEEEITTEKTEETKTATEKTEVETESEKAVFETTEKIENLSLVFPVSGGVTVRAYSPEKLLRSETMNDWRTHNGIDLKAEKGENVFAATDGTVTKVVSDQKLGYSVEIDHGSFTARYCGLSQDNAVSIGKEVKAGEVIGTVGDIPSEASDVPHLHLETVIDGKTVDPFTMSWGTAE